MQHIIFSSVTVLLFSQVLSYPRDDTWAQDDATADMQNQIKQIVAQYFRDTGLDNGDAARLLENSLPLEFGRGHHHHHRYPVTQIPVQVAAIPVLAAAAAATPDRASLPAPALAPALAQAPVIPAPVADVAPPQSQPENRMTAAPIIATNDVTKAAESVTSIPIITAPAAAVMPTQAPALPSNVPASVVPSTATPDTLPPRSTVDPVHHLNQVNKILGNVANGNIVGIVDESLAIRAPPPVRNLVTNILKVVFCNPIDRLFRRCAPNQVDAANNSVTG